MFRPTTPVLIFLLATLFCFPLNGQTPPSGVLQTPQDGSTIQGPVTKITGTGNITFGKYADGTTIHAGNHRLRFKIFKDGNDVTNLFVDQADNNFFNIAENGTFTMDMEYKNGNIPKGTYKLKIYVQANNSQGGAPAWGPLQILTGTPLLTIIDDGSGPGGGGFE